MNISLKTFAWRTLVAIAILVLLIAGFYAEENARGFRAWQQAEQEITLRGDSLNWNDFIPSPVPDDQNFFKAPMMTEWFVKSTNATSGFSLYSLLANPETDDTNITEISASNYLAWCSTFDPQFDQIRQALKRPAARIDGDYDRPFEGPIQNFVGYRTVAKVLAHEAKCHLRLDEPDLALNDLTLLQKFNLTLVESGKPVTLVAAMIHTAITQLYADDTGCGLESHSWRESDLIELQKQLAEMNMLPVVGHSLEAERAGACRLLDSSMDELLRASGANRSASDLGWLLMPGGWIYQNKAVIVTLDEQMISTVDFTNQTVSPSAARIASARLDEVKYHVTPWNFFAVIATPNFSKAVEQMARIQTYVDQAQIACALERYRLANGKYPAALAALVPQYMVNIPHDIINGAPMKYLPMADSNYVLYSVGWNETDDGGIIAYHKDGTEDRDNGDWVWHYPE